MADINISTVPLGQFFAGSMVGHDVNGQIEALGSLSATIDNYQAAYVASLGNGGFAIVARAAALVPGGSLTVNVTFSGTNKDGGALPAYVAACPFQCPPPVAPEASVLFLAGNPSGATPPADPGSATVTLL